MPLLTESSMPKAHISLVQLMGLICHVYSLFFVDKGLYVIQNVYELSYSKTRGEIKSDVIQNLIYRLALIKDLINSVQDMEEEHSKSNIDEMKKTKGNCAVEDWLSPVVSYSDDGQDEEEEDNGHDDNEEDYDNDSDSDDAEAGDTHTDTDIDTNDDTNDNTHRDGDNSSDDNNKRCNIDKQDEAEHTEIIK
ncbi:hypothetical protein G6F57_006575 [Rhizopus arrhizus]|nr:hypothetical protein G6F23_007049 [Rhizopus arrhizus]KAG1423760.1 hypothetical protein G6F58_002681 [Rhizopus delemar]KAG0763166.1 hypothetical protein G6F24_006241 [Rhizopus arrhizus]KAG0791655.1 hypothetical protein G6F22_006081 [Rhizopus arrhizus]KAG0791759.1 hypothetical protein G6F21_004845 [Rhizopus arrhizus]